ncbi:MAG: response regulator [Chloroflexi bacterium]|nr:response regulator [Chloroflexota bacterium]
MKKRSVRVIIASEYPAVRHFLRGAIEKSGTVVVGQAENAGRALALARNLRPDIAVIDCFLPHAIGLDGIPLTRAGGFDAAWTISEEIPNTKVVIVNNLDNKIMPEHALSSDAFLSKESDVPFSLQELETEPSASGGPVFANMHVRTQTTAAQRLTSMSDKAVLFGGLGILGGLTLMLTVIFAAAGVLLTVAGASAVLFGLAAKYAACKKFIR